MLVNSSAAIKSVLRENRVMSELETPFDKESTCKLPLPSVELVLKDILQLIYDQCLFLHEQELYQGALEGSFLIFEFISEIYSKFEKSTYPISENDTLVRRQKED